MLDRIAPDVPVNVERVTFPAMVADGSLFALDGDTYWIDAGTPATYLAANLDLINGRRGTGRGRGAPRRRGGRRGRRSGGRRRARRWATAPSCRARWCSPGAVIGAGALVQDAIIGARARVGDGAVVDDGAGARRRRGGRPPATRCTA